MTVSVLHNGFSYDDDLSEDCLLYHYPDTNRVGSTDESEIRATKNARELGLPIFVITHPYRNARTRDIKLGWVQDWDDASKVFLIRFGGLAPPDKKPPVDDTPFSLKTKRKRKKTESEKDTRSGQRRFKFDCLKRYGKSCAVCGNTVLEVLDAAHLCAAEDNGSDDPRNGLILCANHHRAFDSKLYAIHPETLEIQLAPNMKLVADLGLGVENISHLPNLPHEEALGCVWTKFAKKHGI